MSEERQEECFECGSVSIHVKSFEIQKFKYGVSEDPLELEAKVPVWTCTDCGEAYTEEEAGKIRDKAVMEYLEKNLDKCPLCGDDTFLARWIPHIGYIVNCWRNNRRRDCSYETRPQSSIKEAISKHKEMCNLIKQYEESK